MYTQNAGEPSSLIVFFFSTHFLSVVFLALSHSLGPLWSFAQKTGTFIGPCCIFPTTAPITEATRGRKRNKPNQRCILPSVITAPVVTEETSLSFGVPAGPKFWGACRSHCCHCHCHCHHPDRTVGARVQEKWEHREKWGVLNMLGIPSPALQARTRRLLLPRGLLTGLRPPWV